MIEEVVPVVGLPVRDATVAFSAFNVLSWLLVTSGLLNEAETGTVAVEGFAFTVLTAGSVLSSGADEVGVSTALVHLGVGVKAALVSDAEEAAVSVQKLANAEIKVDFRGFVSIGDDVALASVVFVQESHAAVVTLAPRGESALSEGKLFLEVEGVVPLPGVAVLGAISVVAAGGTDTSPFATELVDDRTILLSGNCGFNVRESLELLQKVLVPVDALEVLLVASAIGIAGLHSSGVEPHGLALVFNPVAIGGRFGAAN